MISFVEADFFILHARFNFEMKYTEHRSKIIANYAKTFEGLKAGMRSRILFLFFFLRVHTCVLVCLTAQRMSFMYE